MSTPLQEVKSKVSALTTKFMRATSFRQPKYKYNGEFYDGPLPIKPNAQRRASIFGAKKAAAPLGPPKAKIQMSKVTFGVKEGEERGADAMDPPIELEDPYFWLRDDDRKNSEVLGYLQAENNYTKDMTNHLVDQTEEIYNDFLLHIKETDAEVPYLRNGYEYYSRTVKGLSYPIYCRKVKGGDKEEILLDLNEEAKGKAHCGLGSLAVSPDNTIIGYGMDFTGNEKYTTYMRVIESRKPAFPNEKLPEETDGDVVFGKENTTFFYVTMDDAQRPYKAWKREIGKGDTMLFEESDPLYYLQIMKTTSGRFLFIATGSSETSEFKFVDLENPDGVKVLVQRQFGIRFSSVDHCGDFFYAVTNKDKCKNQKLVRCSVNSPGEWEDVFEYDEALYITEIDCFKDFMVMSGRQGGFTKLWTLDSANPSSSERKEISFPEQVATCEVHSQNFEFDTPTVRLSYSSPVTPSSVFEYNPTSGELKLLKEKPALHYNRDEYVTFIEKATAGDGTEVPMSVVKRRDLPEGPSPMLLIGYGSYGHCYDPEFSHMSITLLNAGITVAYANIRGGSELGLTWYEDEGKYLSKKNTFSDFSDCARHMINAGHTTADKLAISGRSAGGLLMGAVLNLSPELFKVCVAGVPFVDVINTMSDPSIPLTTGEWEEWGNPNCEKYFEYMKSYSPYDNVEAKDYPSILVTAGLHDPRVAYWEPAKWVAKLRAMKTDTNPLLLKTDLESGHFSASDKYKYLRERAFEYSFLFDQLGVKLNGAVNKEESVVDTKDVNDVDTKA